jgi:hypothetical protein
MDNITAEMLAAYPLQGLSFKIVLLIIKLFLMVVGRRGVIPRRCLIQACRPGSDHETVDNIDLR